MPAEARAIPDADSPGPIEQHPQGTTPALHEEFDVDELQPIRLGDREREPPNFFSHIQFRPPGRDEKRSGRACPTPSRAHY